MRLRHLELQTGAGILYTLSTLKRIWKKSFINVRHPSTRNSYPLSSSREEKQNSKRKGKGKSFAASGFPKCLEMKFLK